MDTTKKNYKGTPRSTYRFKPETLDRLDRLVATIEEEEQVETDRTAVLRKLIHSEFIRRGLTLPASTGERGN